MTKARPRVVVVVTEGANPDLLGRWCAQGLLPGFKRLLDMGTSGPLIAEDVPYEPPGLVSLLTGRRAADHGFFSYWSCHDPEYRPRVLTTADSRHRLVWQDERLADVKFACIGLFGADPPEPLNGSLITYPMYPTLHACYPRTLQLQLAKRGIRPVHDVSIFWTGQPRQELLPRLIEADAQRGRAAAALFDDGHDVALVNLTSIDRTSHIYWQELELGPEREADSAVLTAYQTADRVIQDFLARLDERTTLIAFSEIGFGPLRNYCSVNDELAGAGLLKTTGEGLVDWQQTQAFEAVQGTHGINVNVRGRYTSGRVPESDYERVREEVAAQLLSRVNPRTGRPFFAAVSPREEVYGGEAVAQAPDLILEPADWRYLPLGDPQWARHVHRTWQSGWHRPGSYWAGAGAGFSGGVIDPRAVAPVDVTATIYDLLGRDVPDTCAGRSLAGLAPPAGAAPATATSR